MNKLCTRFLCLLLVGLLMLPGCGKKSGNVPSSSEAASISNSVSDEPIVKIGNESGVAFTLNDGTITYPYGRISMPFSGDANVLGVQDASKSKSWNTTAEGSYKVDGQKATLLQKWSDTDSLTTNLTVNENGSMSIIQKVNSSKGISSSSFSLSVPIKYDVIIPAWGGIRLSATTPDIDNKVTRLEYPREWQAQMFLIQAEKGGLLVYAVDNGTQFKALNVTNTDAAFSLSLETIPQAPFDDYKEFETVEWRMVPYKGDWMTGAMLYKEFASKEFDLENINKAKPDWSSQIQLTLLDDLNDEQLLVELAKKVTPSKTLIIYPGWRKNPYDTAYPDYTPANDAKAKIKMAQKLGFKVGVHCNMLGADMESSDYKNTLVNVHSLDAFTKKPIIESYNAYGKTYAFSQINQASKAWRDLMVKKMTTVVKDLGVDMIHLDQSLICFNDGRGLVDGMTSMQGNVQMQKDIAAALPGVAFSGEGITEVNLRYASFLQVHVYGLNSNTQTYSDERFNQICPITTAIFGEYTSLYHYPAMCTPENEKYYQAWYRSGDQRTGHLSTLMRVTAEQVKNPNETMAMILKEAKWKQDNQPKINTGSDWADGVLFSFKLKNGNISEYRKDTYGEVLIPDIKDVTNTLTRFITGVVTAKLPGSIKDWKIYDNDFIRALNPSNSYLYNSTPRSNNATHIYEIPDNITSQQFTEKDNYAAITLKEIKDSSKVVVDLTRFSGVIRAGEVLNNGETDTTDGSFNSLNAFWYTFKAKGQARHLGDRFMFHPPWKDEGAGIGYSYMEFDVPLEKYGNALFETSVQMASAENARLSDGVIFKFSIWETGDTSKTGMLQTTISATTATPVPVSFDVTKFEGKTITIRVECDSGKTTSNDSSAIVAPKVVQRKSTNDVPVTYKIKTEKTVLGLTSSGGKSSYKALGNNSYEVKSYLSETVYLIYSNKAITIPNDLTMFPFISSWKYKTGETDTPASDLIPKVQVAEVHGELRQGIFAYPPTDGKCTISYLVTLPSGYSGKLYLTGATGLRKGSDNSNGVIFGVSVNGVSIWDKTVNAKQEFTAFSVPLDAYAGKTVLLILYTDSNGSNAYDSAFWGDPYIEVR